MKAELESVLRHMNVDRLDALLMDAVRRYSPSLAEEPATEVFEAALDGAGVPSWRQPVESEETTEDDRASVSVVAKVADQPRGGRAGGKAARRANLIVQLGPEPAALMWVGHVDTIALKHDEDHKVRKDGDLVYGLGAADMKGGCAAMVEAVIAVSEAKIPLKRGVKVAFVVGEEEIGDGSEAVVEVLDSPLTVVGEPTGLIPCIDHYGYLEYRLTSLGRRAHAALPEIGDNAIHLMLSWITDILRQATRLPAGDQMAVSLREIRGGTGVFVTADQCEALLDVHLPPGLDGGVIAGMIEEAKEALPRGGRADLSFEELFWAPGYATHPGDPRLAPLGSAFQAEGLTWEPGTFRSHSDAPTLYTAGTLPVICGPGRLEVAHTRFEHVSLDEVHRAARLYAAMICASCV